jgi:predicted Zn-dependent protease
MARAVLIVATCVIAAPRARSQKTDLDHEFKEAVAQYEAGKYPEAAAQLEEIVREVPDSFEVQELLGLVYAAQSRNDRANDHLEKAVRLKPDSASARTNYANNLLRLGKTELA